MKTTIVTTTINVPLGLRGYMANIRQYHHTDCDLIVIGDRKTPVDATEFCRSLNDECRCTYLDVEQQRQYLVRFPELWRHLPFDSIQRRNVGLVWAWENGADIAITIDDDNFVSCQDFLGRHHIVGTTPEMTGYASSSGWFDVCTFLRTDDDVRFYHRGYPQKERWTEAQQFVTSEKMQRRIAVNAGFWLDDPDIDALTRIHRQPVVRGFKASWQGTFGLQPGTWSPFNSQNTALIREVLPAYFLSPYIGRYDDIWPSYIVNRIAQHLGDAIAFGEPLVRQARNPHDLWKDLDKERNGMILTDEFCAALRSISLTGGTYHECYGEIVEHLPKTWTEGSRWTDSQREWRQKLVEGMQIWHDVFERLGARRQSPYTGARVAAD